MFCSTAISRALKGSGRSPRTVIGSIGIGLRLPQEDEVAVLVMVALLGRFELLAVELSGIDLVVVERLEGGGMAAGVDGA